MLTSLKNIKNSKNFKIARKNILWFFFSVVIKTWPPILRRVHTLSNDNSFTLVVGIGKLTGGHLFVINDFLGIISLFIRFIRFYCAQGILFFTILIMENAPPWLVQAMCLTVTSWPRTSFKLMISGCPDRLPRSLNLNGRDCKLNSTYLKTGLSIRPSGTNSKWAKLCPTPLYLQCTNFKLQYLQILTIEITLFFNRFFIFFDAYFPYFWVTTLKFWK